MQCVMKWIGAARRQRLCCPLSVLVLVVGLTSCGFAARALAGELAPPLRKALQSRALPHQVPVIVHLKEQASLRSLPARGKSARRLAVLRALRKKAQATQPKLVAQLKRKQAERIHPLWIANAVAALVPAEHLAQVAALPGVERVVLDAVLHAPAPLSGTTGAPQWNLSAIGAPELWDRGITGQGVVVASLDTGVDYDHPDLQLRWRGGLNSWYDPHGEHPLIPHDASGHGTQTMGVMVAGDAGGTAVGVAPGASWIAAKIFNDAGQASYSAVHQGFQWLLDPDGDPESDDAPDVVNHSWGLEDPAHGCNVEFEADVEALTAAGILQAFAAGNDGPDPGTGASPANYRASLAVGAVDRSESLAGFSSRGPSACGGDFPALAAPGVDILTTDLYFGLPGAYLAVSGSSVASPHLAGAMALLREAFPDLSVDEARHFLKQSARDLGMAGADEQYGSGMLDVFGAYSAILASPRGSVAINGGAAATGSRAVTLSLAATHQTGTVAAMRFSWDSVHWYGWEPYAAARSARLPAGDGPKTIHVQFRDQEDKVSALYSDSIELDGTPPTGSVLIDGGAAATNKVPVTLTLTAADSAAAVTGMRFSWDNVKWYGWEPYAAARSARLPAGDGVKTIHVQFKDPLGNVSAVRSDSILLDSVPPAGAVTINGGAASTGGRPVTLSLAAADSATAVTGMRFSWDAVLWYGWEPFAATRNATIPGSAPGSYSIHVRFRDQSGNESPVYSDAIEYAP